MMSQVTGRPKSAQPRGFTLLELLMGVVVGSIVLIGVFASYIAVQAAYSNEVSMKGAVEASRMTSSYLERSLRLAGYGVPPEYAFDFRTTVLPGAEKDNYQATTSDPDQPITFVTDDLAFRYRDPTFVRRGAVNNTLTTVTLANPATFTLPQALPSNFNTPLSAGQPLMLACRGANEYLFLRLQANVAATDTTATVAEYGAPFPTYAGAVPPCFTYSADQSPYVMLMHEVRVRVVELDQKPMLAVFRNLSVAPNSAHPDFDPIADNVENFQVAYLMSKPMQSSICCAAAAAPDAAPNNENWVLGDEGDEEDVLPDTAAGAPTYDTSYDSPLRFTAHPSNIRAVRITVVHRSSAAGTVSAAGSIRAVSPLENYTAATAPVDDGFFRAVLTQTIRAPNMASRSFFTPPLVANDLATLNTGGG